MSCLDDLKNALLAVTNEVYHFHAHKPSPPYIVWAEDGAGDAVFANGRMQNQAVAGTVDLFTDDPEDTTLFEGVQAALDGVCAWQLNSVQYEDETGLTHYEWVWEVPMAKITFNAGDEYALKLSQLAAGSEETAKKAVYAAADIVTDKIRENLRANLAGSTQSTGALEASLGITPIQTDKDGVVNAKIGFDGYDEKGVPNQLKARVMESGSSKVQKRPFVRPAVNATKAAAVEAMQKVIDEEAEKIMKG